MEKKNEKWRDLSIKDKIQYVSACCLIASGVIIAFLSFGVTFNIPTGVLLYIAQAFITAGGIFGVSIYFKTKLGEFESKAAQKMEQYLDRNASKIEKYIDKRMDG